MAHPESSRPRLPFVIRPRSVSGKVLASLAAFAFAFLLAAFGFVLGVESASPSFRPSAAAPDVLVLVAAVLVLAGLALLAGALVQAARKPHG